MPANADARNPATGHATAWIMLLAPFVLLALSYHSLPAHVPVLRTATDHLDRFAPKSAFSVFRVPAMNLTHGMIAWTMLSHASDFHVGERRAAYKGLFSTLLFTVAIKSDFEAVELSLPAEPALLQYAAPWLGLATVATVILGLGLAIVRGRRAPLPWPELRLPNRDRAAIFVFLASYVGMVVGSILTSRRF